MSWIRQDITFCADECEHTECYRHQCHMEPGIHSIALLKGLDMECFYYKENGNELENKDVRRGD